MFNATQNPSPSASPSVKKLRVFLSHASHDHDKEVAHRLYDRLLREGWIDPWMDERNLLPGDDRESEVVENIKSAGVVLVCLSKQSLEQDGEFHEQIKLVAKLAERKRERSIFIIPIRLDDCEIPQILGSIQCVDFFGWPDDRQGFYLLILQSLRRKLGFDPNVPMEDRPFHLVSASEPKVVDDLVNLNFGGFNFVKIQQGKFIMGSRASNNLAGGDEHPQRPYEIPYNYWITNTPISNEQFGEYAVSTDQTKLLPKIWKKKLDQPIVNISWREAVKYTNWLNLIFKKEIPSGLVFRLPTEAEWEKASRGEEGAEFPWGNESLDNFLNSEKTGLSAKLKMIKGFDKNMPSDNFGKFHADFSKRDPEKLALDWVKMKLAELRNGMELADVGIFSPVTDSPHDVADMMGSVREWTQSLYWPYPYNVDDGRENLEDPEELGDPRKPNERVVRGHFSSTNERFSVRSAKRAHFPPIAKGDFLGFRIVIAPPVP